MRTACFVDGYNLFYGLLAGTPYKWLNLPSLLRHVLELETPEHILDSIHFFTSGVMPALASRGRVSKEAQDTYLRALLAQSVQVHYGRHQLEPRRAPRFHDKSTPPSRQDMVDIWKLEEKETDVHIAVRMYQLASRQIHLPPSEQTRHIVLVSADTDLTPALRAIREDFPEIRLGVVLPHREGRHRAVPGSLKQHAHWVRTVITHHELALHQFPERVPTRKKPAIKPHYW